MKLSLYPKYKDSGIEWLREIPEGWEVKRLKYISLVRPSNVDKKTEGGETEIRLCNYIDVYNNESIDDFIDFMIASATFDEIKKFRILRGDVLITKDSEEWDDIAVPSFVKGTLETVICGYHLALVRPKSRIIDGKYLFRTFQSYIVNSQFRLSANGITRYGLSKNSISSAVFLVPPLPEQQAIANFLDHKITRIDELIKKNEKLIELLKEKRQAIISHAVTKGLDPNAKMKDSGIEWIGEIPEGWKIKRIKHIAKEKFKNGIFKKKDFYGSGVKLINVFDVYRQNFYIDLNSLDHIEATKKEVKIYSVEAGDILFVRSSLKLEGVGASVCVPYINEPLIFECHLVKMQPSFEIVPEYLINFLNANVVRQRFIAVANTVTMATLGQSSLSTLEVELPPILEQLAIVDYLKRETTKIDRVINKIQSQIETLKEYRQALISNVVTGKVRIYEDQ